MRHLAEISISGVVGVAWRINSLSSFSVDDIDISVLGCQVVFGNSRN